LNPQLIFQFLDLRAQGGLADKAGFGRFAEVPEVSEFDKIL